MKASKWRCRACKTLHDGMATTCPGCGRTQRIPITFPNGHRRYLPRGMTLDGFDELMESLKENPQRDAWSSVAITTQRVMSP